MVQITQTKIEFSKSQDATYIKENETVEIITVSEYESITSDDNPDWFKRSARSKMAVLSYTCIGFKVTRLTSVTTDLQNKVVKEFKFEYVD